MPSDTCILTTFFNPLNSNNRVINFYKFLENISQAINLDDFYVLEIITNEQDKQIKNCKSLSVKNNNIIWQKESGLNYLIKNLNLSKYSKIIVADCDILFKEKDWIEKTSDLLDNHHVCQPFRSINYMNFDHTDLDSTVDGVIYGCMLKNMDAQQGNGGLVVGYNKEYIEYMGGFFDKAVVGGGDTLNILPFLYDYGLNLNFFDNLMQDIRTEYFDYLMNARNYILQNKNKNLCCFADYVVEHLFHGSLENRSYWDRHNLVNNQKYYENFEKDENGLIKYKKDNKLKDVIESYFKSRKESFQENESVVWSDVKYKIEKIEENKFMWLSDDNKFIFKNISEIKMFFEKPEEISNTKIYANDAVINLIFDNKNKAEFNLKDPKKIEIFSDYFIPKNVGKNPDTRRLSVMLKKIEILKKDQECFSEYPLENIL